jgi:hypothetical protein
MQALVVRAFSVEDEAGSMALSSQQEAIHFCCWQ